MKPVSQLGSATSAGGAIILSFGLVLSATIIAGSLVLRDRYEIHVAASVAYDHLWRLDRLTGDIVQCASEEQDAAGQHWCEAYRPKTPQVAAGPDFSKGIEPAK